MFVRIFLCNSSLEEQGYEFHLRESCTQEPKTGLFLKEIDTLTFELWHLAFVKGTSLA